MKNCIQNYDKSPAKIDEIIVDEDDLLSYLKKFFDSQKEEIYWPINLLLVYFISRL